MPAINFQKRFAAAIRSGEKRQTVRLTRRAREGQEVALYVGMRTRSCELIARVKMTSVLPVLIDDDGVLVDGRRVLREEFAIADGFKSFQAMRDFQAEKYGGPGIPISGWVHYWEPPAP